MSLAVFPSFEPNREEERRMKHKTFTHALSCLTHPVVVGSIIFLLINDHLLRQLWPSWWTGKVGDVAWLIFAPFILAPVLAFVVPARTSQHQKAVGIAAFTIIGLIFTLVNLNPAFNTAFRWLIQAVTGADAILLVLDPSDLITFPALWVGWRVWQGQTDQPPIIKLNWMMLFLATFATMANSPTSYDPGISCFLEEDNRLFAIAPWDHKLGLYVSHDSGFSWEVLDDVKNDELPVCEQGRLWQVDELLEISPSLSLRYQWSPQMISASYDGGKTWVKEFSFARGAEVRRTYYRRESQKNLQSVTGYMVDSKTGNVLVSLGQDGILVRTLDGVWQYVSVGDYHLLNLNEIDRGAFLLGELGLALMLFLWTVSFVYQVLFKPGFWFLIIMVLTACLWLPLFFVRPAFLEGLQIAIPYPVGLINVSIVFVLGLYSFVKIWGRAELGFARKVVVVTAVSSPLLFLLPYFLWVQGIIPKYATAMTIALTLAIIPIFIGYRAVRHKKVMGVQKSC